MDDHVVFESVQRSGAHEEPLVQLEGVTPIQLLDAVLPPILVFLWPSHPWVRHNS